MALLCSFFIFFHESTIAQKKLEQSSASDKIPRPILNYVTIDLLTGYVEVNWEHTPPVDLVGYYIQRFRDNGSFKEIPYYINSGTFFRRSFSYPEVHSNSVGFNVFAFRSENDQSEHSDTHFTVFNKLKVDSCNGAIDLNWEPYKILDYSNKPIENNIKDYTIYRLTPDLYPLYTASYSGNYTYKFNDTEEGKEYFFVVSANRNKNEWPSFSNVDSITFPKLSPNFIIGNSTINYGNQIDVNFIVDKSYQSGSYILYRSEKGKNDFIALTELNRNAEGIINYSDKNAGFKEFEYKLVYKNTCSVEGKGSIPITSILLKGKSESMKNRLSWNNFLFWKNGIDSVNLYRTSEGNTDLIASFSGNETEYIDELDPNDQISGEICYQIKYISNPDSFNNIHTSISNTFCVSMLGEIFVPTAFTPNGDGTNDEIRPTFSILPTKYVFMVYNRYGGKIFETNNISEGWDGRLSDGKKALEGTYIYFVKIENGAGKVLEKRGNFSVIYP